MKRNAMRMLVLVALGFAACKADGGEPDAFDSKEELIRQRDELQLEAQQVLNQQRAYNAEILASFDRQGRNLPEQLANPDEDRSDYPIVNLWAEARTSVVFAGKCLRLADRYVRQMRTCPTQQRLRDLELWSTELMVMADSTGVFAAYSMLRALAPEEARLNLDLVSALYRPQQRQNCTNREASNIPPELEEARFDFIHYRYWIMDASIDEARIQCLIDADSLD